MRRVRHRRGPPPVTIAGSAAEPTAGVDVTTAPPARFAALRNRDCRIYLGGGMLDKAADNIEQYQGGDTQVKS